MEVLASGEKKLMVYTQFLYVEFRCYKYSNGGVDYQQQQEFNNYTLRPEEK